GYRRVPCFRETITATPCPEPKPRKPEGLRHLQDQHLDAAVGAANSQVLDDWGDDVEMPAPALGFSDPAGGGHGKPRLPDPIQDALTVGNLLIYQRCLIHDSTP